MPNTSKKIANNWPADRLGNEMLFGIANSAPQPHLTLAESMRRLLKVFPRVKEFLFHRRNRDER